MVIFNNWVNQGFAVRINIRAICRRHSWIIQIKAVCAFHDIPAVIATCRNDIDFLVQFLSSIANIKLTAAIEADMEWITQPVSEDFISGVVIRGCKRIVGWNTVRVATIDINTKDTAVLIG